MADSPDAAIVTVLRSGRAVVARDLPDAELIIARARGQDVDCSAYLVQERWIVIPLHFYDFVIGAGGDMRCAKCGALMTRDVPCPQCSP